MKDAFGNKQYKPEDIQELFCKLFNDVQNIHEELAEYINTPSWNQLLNNDFLSLPENESFHLDVPSSSRPPAKPPDDDEIKPDSGSFTVKVVGDISKHYVLMPRLLPTQPTLASNEKKSPHLLSHHGFKAFHLSFESPMMIYGGDSPTLDFPFLYFYPP
nr:hypothetical protein [Tanacetum cinerariifolium]